MREKEMREGSTRDLAAATAAVAAANVFWGFNYVATKFALFEIDAFALHLVRVTAVLLLMLMLLVLRRRGRRFTDVLKHWRAAIIPAAGLLASQVCYLYGLQFTSPAHSALMYTLLPIFTALMAFFLISERLRPAQVVGIGIAFVGAVVLAGEDGLTLESRYLLGDMITFVAVIGWALYTVLSKPLATRIGAIPTLVLMLAMGWPVSLALTLGPTAAQPWAEVSLTAWAGAAFLILLGTFGAYVFYQFSLKHLQSSIVAAFAYSQPVLAAIFSVILLGEVLSAFFYASFALIFAGLMIARYGGRGRREAVPAPAAASGE
ncbi:MAG TPA: DMT family transporter [Acidobacteriota bacterium]|nr:DMT family transporter [Acidobacteriota bacterium]